MPPFACRRAWLGFVVARAQILGGVQVAGYDVLVADMAIAWAGVSLPKPSVVDAYWGRHSLAVMCRQPAYRPGLPPMYRKRRRLSHLR